MTDRDSLVTAAGWLAVIAAMVHDGRLVYAFVAFGVALYFLHKGLWK